MTFGMSITKLLVKRAHVGLNRSKPSRATAVGIESAKHGLTHGLANSNRRVSVFEAHSFGSKTIHMGSQILDGTAEYSRRIVIHIVSCKEQDIERFGSEMCAERK
jgi:hypothetical protein